jgi:hypothetical protein
MAQNTSPQMNSDPDPKTTTSSERLGVYDSTNTAASESGRVGVYDRPATRLSTLSTPMLIGLLILILVLAALSFIVFRAIF